MQSQIVLRDIAAATAHLVHLSETAGSDGHSRPNAVPVGFSPDGFDQNPILLFAEVFQKAWSVIHVVDDNLEAAVIVQVRHSCTTRRPRVGDSGTCLIGYFQKRSIALVPEELAHLLVWALAAQLFNFRIDVSIDHEYVLPAIIIKIKEAGSPAEESSIDPELRRISDIDECPIAIVAIERGNVIGKIGLDEIEEAVQVIVAC